MQNTTNPIADIQQNLQKAFDNIQNLSIQATEGNISIVQETLNMIRGAFIATGQMQAEMDAANKRIRELEDRNIETMEKFMPAPDDSICDEMPENIVQMPEKRTEGQYDWT